MSADADRIVELERAVDRWRDAYGREKSAHDRTKAELAEAHAVAATPYTAAIRSRSREVKGIIGSIFGTLRTVTGASLAEARRARIEQVSKEKRTQWSEIVRERDAAQAEAAAIQLAVLARIEQGAEEWKAADDARGISINDYYHVAMRALFLRFPLGRALAARVPLLEAVARDARPFANLSAGLRDSLAALDENGGGS